MQTLKNLRNSLTDLDDRWQVEIWIKHIAKYLEVDDNLEFDTRDTFAAVPAIDEQPTAQDQVKGKKRSLNTTTGNTKKQRSGNKKSRSVVESSDEDTPEPMEDSNQYIFDDDA